MNMRRVVSCRVPFFTFAYCMGGRKQIHITGPINGITTNGRSFRTNSNRFISVAVEVVAVPLS
jgi:hypothetical protein